jgi:hypothetical protein
MAADRRHRRRHEDACTRYRHAQPSRHPHRPERRAVRSLAGSADGPALAISDDWGRPAPRDLSSLPQPSSGVVATHRSGRSAPASIAAAPAARTRRIGDPSPCHIGFASLFVISAVPNPSTPGRRRKGGLSARPSSSVLATVAGFQPPDPKNASSPEPQRTVKQVGTRRSVHRATAPAPGRAAMPL